MDARLQIATQILAALRVAHPDTNDWPSAHLAQLAHADARALLQVDVAWDGPCPPARAQAIADALWQPRQTTNASADD